MLSRLNAKVISIDSEKKNALGGIGEMVVWASTENKDRHDEIVRASMFDESIALSEETGKWPPFLAAHMHAFPDGGVPVLGRVVWADNKVKRNGVPGMKARVAFAPEDVQSKARAWMLAYKGGWLTDVSVGFISKEATREPGETVEHLRGDWIELSGAAVGSNLESDAITVTTKSLDGAPPEVVALIEELKGLLETQEQVLAALDKTVVPFKRYPLADANSGWRWNASEATKVLGDPADWRRFAGVHTWFDPKADENSPPEVRAAYKLPHHRAGADGLETVFRGVVAAMGALLGARGGVDIPGSDRRAVYNHLAKHYREFEKDAPEFRDGWTGEEFLKHHHAQGCAFTLGDLDEAEEELRAGHLDDDKPNEEDEEQKQTSENDDNVFVQVSRLDVDYIEDTLREVALVGEKPRVFATIGKLTADGPESPDRITFLRFPKEDDWTVNTALEWMKDADLDQLLRAALGDDTEPPATVTNAMVEAFTTQVDRLEAALQQQEAQNAATAELSVRLARMLDQLQQFEVAATKALATSKPSGSAAQGRADGNLEQIASDLQDAITAGERVIKTGA